MKIKQIITGIVTMVILAGCVASAGGTKGDGLQEKIELVSLKFYTADRNGKESRHRIYNNEFSVDAADFIWYELLVENRTITGSSVLLKEKWYDSVDMLIYSEERTMTLPEGQKYLEYSAGIREEWKKDHYVLKLYQDSLKLAEKEFKIY